MPEGRLQGNKLGMGGAGAAHTDELQSNATGEHGGDVEHDDAGMTNSVADQGHLLKPASEEKTMREYVAALQDVLRAMDRHARIGLQRATMHQ